jgi:hypothetical protein
MLVALPLACFVIVGCMRIGQPTSEERAELATWSKAVSDQDRIEVSREAATHTDWMERKKTQWMISEYRARSEKARAKQARRAAATQRAATQRAATLPTTDMATPSTAP